MTTNTEAPSVESVLWNFLYATPRTVDEVRTHLSQKGIEITDVPRAIRRLRGNTEVTTVAGGALVEIRPITGSKPRAFTYEAY